MTPSTLITISLMAVGMLMLAACPGYATLGGFRSIVTPAVEH